MEVCKDGETVWHYEEKTQSYHAKHPRLGAQGNVMGKFLTDPNAVWQSRCTARGITPNTLGAENFRPHSVTYALWNHWQGVTSGNSNN